MSQLLQGAGTAALGSSFLPGATILARYDAAALLGAGTPDGALATWPDTSGLTGRDASQATALLRPAFRAASFGGRGGVRGNGLGQRMQTAALTFGAGTTWYSVVQFNAAYLAATVWADALSVLLSQQRTGSTVASAVGQVTAVQTTTPESPHCYGVAWGTTYRFKCDGNSDATTAGATLQEPGGVTLFDYSGGTVSAACDIGELIVCQGVHTPGAMAANMAILKAKWGTP